MASPRRGVLAPPLFRFAPGIGARKRGTGEDMIVGFGCFRLFEIFCVRRLVVAGVAVTVYQRIYISCFLIVAKVGWVEEYIEVVLFKISINGC